MLQADTILPIQEKTTPVISMLTPKEVEQEKAFVSFISANIVDQIFKTISNEESN